MNNHRGHSNRLTLAGWALLGACLGGFANAANNAGTRSITGITVRDSGDVLLQADSRWQDSEYCNGWFDTIGTVIIPRDHPGYAGLLALALTARATTGQKLQVYTQGCTVDRLYGVAAPRVSFITL